jgi:hypothetical protein
MVFHEPPRGGRGATTGAICRGIAAVLLLSAVAACGRSELDGGEGSDEGGAAGQAGGTSTGGGGGAAGGSSGVGGGANSSGVGGGAASGGASGQAGSSGASGSGGAAENCSNGLDDDRDGNIDCADSDCVAFTCAPRVPGGGWVGPLSIWQGYGAPATCTGANGFPTEVINAMTGVSTPGASSCPSCACGSPQGVSCQVGSVLLFNNDACSGQGGTFTIAQGVCAPFVSLMYDPASVRWQAAPAAGGACVPRSSGSAVFPPVKWDYQVRACGDPTPNPGGCGAGTCVQKQKAPFDEQLCVYQRGDLACPVGPYGNKSVYFTNVDDSRTCTACDCNPPTATTCNGNMKLYTDPSCSVDETTLSSVLECSALAPDPTPPSPPYMSLRSIRYTGWANPGGYCTANPSVPIGGVRVTEPITLCCTR